MPQIKKVATTSGLLLLFGSVVSAQLVRPLPPSAVPHTVTSVVANPNAPKGQGMIHGTAVDGDANPLPNATVRLRNLNSKQIEKVSTANLVGEFTFIAQPDIPYVVEIADHAGEILAVGNVLVTQPGEVAGAIVMLPVRLASITPGDTAGSVMAAAATAGITPTKSELPPPASPEN